MKTIQYIIMAIAATTMFSSCAEDKQVLGNADATGEVEIIDLKPLSVTFKITTKENSTTSGYAIITDSNNTVVSHGWSRDEASDDNTMIIDAGGPFAPGTTYNYTIFGSKNLGSMTEDIEYEIASGSFTTPSEYELTPLFLTESTATLEIELPNGLFCRDGKLKICYSKSPDFTDMKTKECSAQDNNETLFIATLDHLQSNTKYYVKLSGVYSYDFDYGYVSDVLYINMGNFTTTDNSCRINEPIAASVVCALDSYAMIDFRLPDYWSWAGCEVMYSTDPQFIKDVKYTTNVSLDGNICVCTLTDLSPNTTYYVALSKGNLTYQKADSIYNLDFSLVMPVELESLTTGQQNKIENGAVDLGLSVKWALCDIGADTPDEVGNYFTFDISSNFLGDGWAIPTRAQWAELAEKCKIHLAGTRDNPYYLVIGPNGNYIRLNCAGFLVPFDQLLYPHHLYYWTSEADDKDADGGVALSDFLDGQAVFKTLYALNSLIVRAVTKCP